MTQPGKSHFFVVHLLVGGFKHFFIFHNIWDNPSHWLMCLKMVKTTNQPHILRYFLSSIPWKKHHDWTSEVTAISFGRRSALSPWHFWMPWMGAVWKERSVKPMVNHHFPYWMILSGYNWRKSEVFFPFPWNKYGTWSFPYQWYIIISIFFHINSISIKFPETRRFPWYKWVRCALIPHGWGKYCCRSINASVRGENSMANTRLGLFVGMSSATGAVRFTQGILGNDPCHHIRNVIIPATLRKTHQ